MSNDRVTRLGEHVRNHRAQLLLSIDAIAATAGLSPVTWGKVEAGRGRSQPATYVKVARALGWHDTAIPDYLAGRTATPVSAR